MCTEGNVLNAQQAADYLGVPLGTVRDMVRRRALPHFRMSNKPNGHLRFRRSDLDSWIEQRIVPATGPLSVVETAALKRRR